jgi:hypothetical protein
VCTFDVVGSVNDDGLPYPVTVEWSGDVQTVSGYETEYIAFADPHSLQTQVVLRRWENNPNYYILYHEIRADITLTATDGWHTVSETVGVYCNE